MSGLNLAAIYGINETDLAGGFWMEPPVKRKPEFEFEPEPGSRDEERVPSVALEELEQIVDDAAMLATGFCFRKHANVSASAIRKWNISNAVDGASPVLLVRGQGPGAVTNSIPLKFYVAGDKKGWQLGDGTRGSWFPSLRAAIVFALQMENGRAGGSANEFGGGFPPAKRSILAVPDSASTAGNNRDVLEHALGAPADAMHLRPFPLRFGHMNMWLLQTPSTKCVVVKFGGHFVVMDAGGTWAAHSPSLQALLDSVVSRGGFAMSCALPPTYVAASEIAGQYALNRLFSSLRTSQAIGGNVPPVVIDGVPVMMNPVPFQSAAQVGLEGLFQPTHGAVGPPPTPLPLYSTGVRSGVKEEILLSGRPGIPLTEPSSYNLSMTPMSEAAYAHAVNAKRINSMVQKYAELRMKSAGNW